MPRLSENLLIFARILRRAGIAVQPARVADLVEALGYVDLAARDEVYHASRALLVHRHDHLAIFDRAFAAFWREHLETGSAAHAAHSAERRVAAAATVEAHAAEELDQVASSSMSGADAAHDGEGEAGAAGPERLLKTWSPGAG